MTERSWGDHFAGTVHLNQKPGAKRDNGMFQPTWHCCMCCNPANGRVDFEGNHPQKPSFIIKDELEAYQLISLILELREEERRLREQKL
jgi:hypothetical protein